MKTSASTFETHGSWNPVRFGLASWVVVKSPIFTTLRHVKMSFKKNIGVVATTPIYIKVTPVLTADCFSTVHKGRLPCFSTVHKGRLPLRLTSHVLKRPLAKQNHKVQNRMMKWSFMLCPLHKMLLHIFLQLPVLLKRLINIKNSLNFVHFFLRKPS